MIDALGQTWPPFVLVAGLLLIGAVAAQDGLFAAAGARLEALPGPPAALLAACLALVAVVTAVLNLDTAVVFLTPVLVHAARARGTDEAPFLYGAVFMANASSLPLPGANLTNLIVVAGEPGVSGAEYAVALLPAALVASAVTAAGVLLWHRRSLRGATVAPARAEPLRDRLGAGAALLAGALILGLREPALPVLAVGLVVAAIRLAQGRVALAELARAADPRVLGGLFALTAGLGALARSVSALSDLTDGASRAATTTIGALAAVTVNNLPAAALLSAHAPQHPRALLIGLDLGPNLAVTGSLSAVLWWRAARAVDARPSALAFSRQGLVLAPLAMAAALLVA